MRISSNSNITFPCNICNTNIKDTDSATQCNIHVNSGFISNVKI